jgi:hypothetical protein
MVAEVDRYRQHKLREADQGRAIVKAWQERCAALKTGEERPPRPRPTMLSGSSINATITRLGMILHVADEQASIAARATVGIHRPPRSGAHGWIGSRSTHAHV